MKLLEEIVRITRVGLWDCPIKTEYAIKCGQQVPCPYKGKPIEFKGTMHKYATRYECKLYDSLYKKGDDNNDK